MSTQAPPTMPKAGGLPFQGSSSVPPLGKSVEIRFLDGAEETVTAQLRRVNRGFLQLICQAPVERDRKCELKFDGCRLMAETVYCMEQGDSGLHLVGVCKISDQDQSEPRETRVSVSLSATMTYAGVPAPVKVKIVDMSQSGMGLELPRAIAVGEQVAVDLGDGVAFGEVKHCRKEGNVYRAGILTDEFLPRETPGSELMKPPTGSGFSSLLGKLRDVIGFSKNSR